MSYEQGARFALMKLGFSFGTPGKAMAAHAAGGALLGGAAGAGLADEGNGGMGMLGGAMAGAGAGLGLKHMANRGHMASLQPRIDSALANASKHKDSMVNFMKEHAAEGNPIRSDVLRGRINQNMQRGDLWQGIGQGHQEQLQSKLQGLL